MLLFLRLIFLSDEFDMISSDMRRPPLSLILFPDRSKYLTDQNGAQSEATSSLIYISLFFIKYLTLSSISFLDKFMSINDLFEIRPCQNDDSAFLPRLHDARLNLTRDGVFLLWLAMKVHTL